MTAEGEGQQHDVQQIISQRFLNTKHYKLPSLEDFQAFRSIALSPDGWEELSKKENYYTVYRLFVEAPSDDGQTTKTVAVFKCEATKSGLNAEAMYNMLHDPEYRKEWDDNMVHGFNICKPSKYADIGFYMLKFPMMTGLNNRYSIAQRNWHKFTDSEYVIFNHSVDAPANFSDVCQKNNCTIKKSHVEMTSYCSGYYMTGGTGAEDPFKFVYITCSEIYTPLPAWLINYVTKSTVPSFIGKLTNMGAKHATWKNKDESKWTWQTDEWCKSETTDEYKQASELALQNLQQQ